MCRRPSLTRFSYSLSLGQKSTHDINSQPWTRQHGELTWLALHITVVFTRKQVLLMKYPILTGLSRSHCIEHWEAYVGVELSKFQFNCHRTLTQFLIASCHRKKHFELVSLYAEVYTPQQTNASYLYNIDPRPFPKFMAHQRPLFPLLVRQRPRLYDHACICACCAAFGEGARIDY
jgi:hypothetical protein